MLQDNNVQHTETTVHPNVFRCRSDVRFDVLGAIAVMVMIFLAVVVVVVVVVVPGVLVLSLVLSPLPLPRVPGFFLTVSFPSNEKRYARIFNFRRLPINAASALSRLGRIDNGLC